MTIVTKNFNVFCETKNITETDDGTLYIEGIANTGQPDLVGDVVTETALKQIVEQAPQRNLHYNHNNGKKDLLGRIKESELRPEGAWIRTRILDEQKEWLQSYIDQEIIFGQSISGCCTYEDGSYDDIISWDLTEISLTDTPCDPGTMGTVAISKSFDDLLVTLKNKEEEKEKHTMAEDNINKDEIIQIVNDAFNERKEELLEQIRGELNKEYDAKLEELAQRINTLEEKLDQEPGKKPEENEDPKGQEGEGDDGKSFEDAVQKAVEQRVEEILEGLTKGVTARYNKNEHITERDSDDVIEDKAYSAREIAEMLG